MRRGQEFTDYANASFIDVRAHTYVWICNIYCIYVGVCMWVCACVCACVCAHSRVNADLCGIWQMSLCISLTQLKPVNKQNGEMSPLLHGLWCMVFGAWSSAWSLPYACMFSRIMNACIWTRLWVVASRQDLYRWPSVESEAGNPAPEGGQATALSTLYTASKTTELY